MLFGTGPASAPVVVFDLDGTLIDTAPDLVTTLNAIFAREGLPQVDYQSARTMVGGGARMMIERGLKASGRTLPVTDTERLVREYIEYYADHLADRSRAFPGLENALDKLTDAGCRLAVCTNKLEWLSVRLLGALSLLDRFSVICGADTFGIPKPNAAILLGTIARAGGNPNHAVMVGDSLTDIATARAAKVPVIAVNFGYSDAPISQFNPDRVVGTFTELPAAALDLLGQYSGRLKTRL